MAHYASATPKRHFGYSNSPYIRMLDKGVLQWKNRGGNRQKVQTAVSYKSESGKTCYKGTAALKKTEILGIGWAIVFHPFFLQDRNTLKHHFRVYKTMKIKTMYFGLSL